MGLIVHLSDLHLLFNPTEQESIFDGLVHALRDVRQRWARPVDLLVITGDVFDSSTLDSRLAITRFLELFAGIGRALGGEPPTVILPGNHDRRRGGLFGPHDERLFHALKAALDQRAWVHGCTTPFLSAVVPRELHRQRFWVIAYDSTYLPHGFLSAGGALRQEDLLSAASQIERAGDDDPVLFLLHHHLVPTPITDLGVIEIEESASRLLRWGIEKALPKLVANADREELTMTALGAGTALSTLHTLGRAVLVLHGHKHYATSRVLDGTVTGHGDVLVVSAGSCGTAQRWSSGETQNAARLWPSFNVIDWQGETLEIDSVSFPWKGGAGPIAVHPLVRAQRSGARWNVQRLPLVPPSDLPPELEHNRSLIHLAAPSMSHDGLWDYTCERDLSSSGKLVRYVETVEGAPGGRCLIEPFGAELALPADVHLDVEGITRYRVERSVFRTLAAAREAQGHRASAFTQVNLMSRYASKSATLELVGLGAAASAAFASATDLGTGLERPLRLERGAIDGSVVAELEDCPARTLLRIYWPLEQL
ncbi:MAG TPA: metallophosphoesterase [Polyangiaceae bacterium]|nr:metallophosphoesterase [Polyangiaceae bacterium]